MDDGTHDVDEAIARRVAIGALGAVVWAILGTGPAVAATVTGQVFSDDNGNGTFDPAGGERALAGVVIALERSFVARTDDDGRFEFRTRGHGIVWVRIPDGYRPTPVWHDLSLHRDPAPELAFGLIPSAASGPVVFAHITDTQLDSDVTRDAVTRAFRQVVERRPALHFVVNTGDLTSDTKPYEFRDMSVAERALSVPLVPVPGNHDWYDRGAMYRRFYGPPFYSFDAGGVHFIVNNFKSLSYPQTQFVLEDLRFVERGRPVVMLTHGPPPEHVARRWRQLGVDFLFTGHMHANRVFRDGDVVEYNTQPLVFGGIDYTPAGWRVAAWDGEQFAITHHHVVSRPQVELVFPRAGECVAAGSVDVLASVEIGEPFEATLSIDGEPARAMSAAGGWIVRAPFEGRTGATYELSLHVRASGGRTWHRRVRACVRHRPSAPEPGLDWPQLQGGPERRGARDIRLPAPLRRVWARALGGHVRGGSAVVAGGLVVVGVQDLDDGRDGGVVAYDIRSGVERWRYRTRTSVQNAPAIADGLVVFSTDDGVVHAVEHMTGAEVWRRDIGDGLAMRERWLYATPTVRDGRVYIGLHDALWALSLTTGEVLWSSPVDVYDWMTLASAAVDDQRGVTVTGRSTVIAFDVATGQTRWSTEDKRNRRPIHATPLLAGDTVFLMTTSHMIAALDMATGTRLWRRWITRWQDRLGNEAIAGLAYDGQRLLVATPDRERGLIAVSADTGDIDWFLPGGRGLLHPFAYRGQARGFAASPVITGDLVWIGGTDGVLRAVDLGDGRVRWSMDLGAPILSGVAVSGPYLFAVTYDGVLHALVTEQPDDMVVAVPRPLGTRTRLQTSRWPLGMWLAALPLVLGMLIRGSVWLRRRL